MITESGLKLSIIAKVVWKRIAFFFTLSSAVVVSYGYWGGHVQAPDTPLAIFGTLLAILLGFRVNNAYQRWWDARLYWGKIVDDSRTSARLILSFLRHYDAELSRQLVYRHIAFPYALKNSLRGQPVRPAIERFFESDEISDHLSQDNIPGSILAANSTVVAELERAGVLSQSQQRLLEDRLSLLTDAQGGCERIKRTVFPYDYRFYTTAFVNIFSCVVPFVLVDEAQWLTVPWTVFVSFALSAIDHLAKAIENPFENRPNDTPMSSISTMIERDLRQMLGEDNIPDHVVAQNGYLL